MSDVEDYCPDCDHEAHPCKKHSAWSDPVDRIEWRECESLKANSWNPNVVIGPELKLLEHSILSQGWVQPVLISKDGIIIDGFHRWMLSRESKALREKYAGRVPCVVMDLTPAQAMCLTVRINRAKGTHVAVRMSDIIKALIDQHGMKPAEIAKEIGGTKAEVDLLYQDSIFEARNLKDYKYSKAWVPVEDGT